ncbi:MAG: Mevalonate kinase [Candidatus Roizmanbacteria bacterium GW2011_GWA2_36_23]|uniref:Mevalonate kinase n=1 Tax=Candidatus Roizmanbacteria bacterium GW2011_GWA2_36_23 TaxID=1618480 RepID=A0A0G0E3T0_9BACT|nr:MAG: Mevalonate kinase [Candidatus Roizmanbacteria bacterium GW2011_GWA2_36_23]
MKIKVSAPGKLLLFGEHSVVYGYPCLVTAVDKRIFIEGEMIEGSEDQIFTPQVKENKFVLEAIRIIKEKFQIKKAIRISTFGDFSHRVGLGSSSAVTVATLKLLSELFGIEMSQKQIFDFSYEVVLNIQKVGSGFDVAVATFGKTIYFVKAGKVIEPINVDNLPLMVGYSQIKADTPTLILKVAEMHKIEKEKTEIIFQKITALVEKAKNNIANFELVGRLMTENHQLLKELGVSTEKLDHLVEAAVDAGAWGAKLSGAGGGDCMICLVNPLKRKWVEDAIIKEGGEIIKVQNNAQGVIIEEKID